MPGFPLAYFILVETYLSLGRLETILYGPSPARNPDQLFWGRASRSVLGP
jgi:hypothetical protein